MKKKMFHLCSLAGIMAGLGLYGMNLLIHAPLAAALWCATVDSVRNGFQLRNELVYIPPMALVVA